MLGKTSSFSKVRAANSRIREAIYGKVSITRCRAVKGVKKKVAGHMRIFKRTSGRCPREERVRLLWHDK